MSAQCFDIFSCVFAVLSAVLWGGSAFINIPFGYDSDLEVKSAFQKIGYFNFGGAIFAMFSALSQAAKYFIGT